MSLRCVRQRSDMTPCVIVDGSICRADDGMCVGCGEWVLVNVREAARMLDVHENTIRAWSDNGTLTDHRVAGPYRRFRWEDVWALRLSRRPS